MKFIRPNTQEDIEYRKKQCRKFIINLKEVLSGNLDLRFHGTSIYLAEQIIRSREISHNATRYDGAIKSLNEIDKISASDVNSIIRTIECFLDIAKYDRCLPCGCMFVLIPKDKEDATYGNDLMSAVDFQQNPEQLFSVVTTPENIKRVKKWMNEATLDSSCVHTFEEFLKVVKVKSEKLDSNVRVNHKVDLPNISSEIVNEQQGNMEHLNVEDLEEDIGK